ncbi:MAG: hypothetical protein HUJ68_01655 [Clostridia bacterium]|nr:hypothetical protein [Clostridia bacterium]
MKNTMFVNYFSQSKLSKIFIDISTKNVLIMLVIVSLFSSCEDEKLAKQLEGTWSKEINTNDENGFAYLEEICYSFKYHDFEDKSGGYLIEETTREQSFVEDARLINFTLHSKIEGEYEVISKSLSFLYNLSTLQVEVSNIEVKSNTTGNSLFDLSNALNSINSQMRASFYGTSMEEIYAKKISEIARQELYEQYESDNLLDTSFSDLKIEKNVLSFISSEGRMIFNKKTK